MKVTKEHQKILRDMITPLDTDENRDRYRKRDIPRAEHVKDIDKRYRWDLLWTSRAMDLHREIYEANYLDAHLDTALRSIVAPL